MSKKKKRSRYREWNLTPKERLQSARTWVFDYQGKKIVRDYRKRYGIGDPRTIKELKSLGVKLDPKYLEGVLFNINRKKLRKKQAAAIIDFDPESNETFAYIVGYTSWGFAYGVTWEEMERAAQQESLGIEAEDYEPPWFEWLDESLDSEHEPPDWWEVCNTDDED
ncbi:MAG TPA: hypothetical protein PLL06_16290 [Acidobacteriota bacterium]|nr:hypothetical protein [Acidobacteriota bacterium]HNG93398.1 hypothetical protein [Acidobacteriota bacterium]HNH82350.1 hypothetical protein [Acidobacteriota bacterium]